MTSVKMDWKHLLNRSRLGHLQGRQRPDSDDPDIRSAFLRDYDRIVFSTAFRRLQGKTQVFPIPETDMIHTRLSHSLEVACVGRSLGATVARDIEAIAPSGDDVASIVSAACLAHDIGNPPFGHAGEAAIAHYFRHGPGIDIVNDFPADQKGDFVDFEGNAAGFRVLTSHKTTQTELPGGLGLTLPTLATFLKYPRASYMPDAEKSHASEKKFGLFFDDVACYRAVADTLGLPQKDGASAWYRHPFAFLTEAADDICYLVLDFEDGYKLGLVDYATTVRLFEGVIHSSEVSRKPSSLAKILDEREKIGYLRAKTIQTLVLQAASEFLNHREEILHGTYDEALCDKIPAAAAMKEIRSSSVRKIYGHRPVVQTEAAGFEVLPGLLDAFLNAALMNPDTAKSQKLLSLVSPQYLDKGRRPFENRYKTAMNIVEFVSCMTDTYAIDTYRILKGINLPNYSP